MSAEEQTQTEAQTQTEPTVEKDVTVIAYGSNPDMSERSFAQVLDQSRDYTERTTNRTDSHKLKHENRWGEDSYTTLDKEAVEALAGEDALQETEEGENLSYEIEVGDTVIEVEVTFSERFRYNEDRAVKAARDSVVSDYLPDELTGGLTVKYSSWFQNDQNETKVRVNSRGIDYRRVLVHQSERGEGGEMFETEEEYPSAKFEVTMEGTEEEVEAWSEEVVAPFMENVNKLDGIRKVRLTDCKQKVEKEGDCFNAL